MHLYADDEVGPRRFLMCTDGLTNYVPAQVIAEILTQTEGGNGLTELVDRALNAGAPDNVTCLLVETGR